MAYRAAGIIGFRLQNCAYFLKFPDTYTIDG